jgi:sialate O-acetylesterase
MKRNFIVLYLLIVLLSARAGSITKVACVGNSVTYGLGLPDRARQAYPVVLQRLLGKSYEVRNFGHSGTTLLRKGHRPYNEQQEYRDALAFKADMVVLHLGLNDTDPRNWPNYNSQFNSDYQALINSFRTVNPNVKIWICLLSPIFDRHPRFESGTRDWHQAIQQHIRQIAKSNNVGLIDIFSPLYHRPDLFPDALHPNPEGAQILAQTVFSALTGNYGGLRMDPLYGNGMVMQQHEPVVFSGTANAGETVKVTFNGSSLKATAGPDGRWQVSFKPMTAGGPYHAKIVAKSGKLSLNPIYMGEVWLCSGQSNMELPVMATRSARADTACAASQRLLHLYNMPAAYPTNAIKWTREVMDSVNKLLYLRHEGWQQCSPKSAAHFSAIAYHFGRQLADSLQVPVGIICNAVGGTTTESWIDRHTLEWEFPAVLRDWYHGDFGQPWARERALLNISNAASPKLQRHPYQPAYMFEAGMLPLRGYAIKGVAWYQGESNAHNIELHARLFTLLEKSWRTFFGNGNLPFYFVQLSSLNRPSWPEFRNSQRLLAKQLPHTWMVVTTDVGDSLDVHYRNKQPVGERLARQALRHTYGHSLVSEGPACAGVALQATKGGGGELVLTFKNAEGLHATGTSVIGFELAGDDGIYHPATAHISDGKVTVSSQQVSQPVSVRYAWQPYTRANLVNGAGLPCSTFEEEVSK